MVPQSCSPPACDCISWCYFVSVFRLCRGMCRSDVRQFDDETAGFSARFVPSSRLKLLLSSLPGFPGVLFGGPVSEVLLWLPVYRSHVRVVVVVVREACPLLSSLLSQSHFRTTALPPLTACGRELITSKSTWPRGRSWMNHERTCSLLADWSLTKV